MSINYHILAIGARHIPAQLWDLACVLCNLSQILHSLLSYEVPDQGNCLLSGTKQKTFYNLVRKQKIVYNLVKTEHCDV